MAITAPPACPADKGGESPWEVVAVGPGRLAVPRGWRSIDRIKPTMPVYRQGDGLGVPALDETQAPLQIGLAVEMFPGSKESVKAIMSGLIAGARKAPRLELVGKVSVETVKLSDGTEAMLLKAEFIKEGSRRSLQMKLVAKDADSNAWIVSGHLVGGKESKWPTAKSSLARWLEVHLTSLSLDEKKFDPERVKAAYQDRDRK
ncbi:MAG: hypothetical protein ACRD4T_13500 [Candidatus Acidiferrales bacterium]